MMTLLIPQIHAHLEAHLVPAAFQTHRIRAFKYRIQIGSLETAERIFADQNALKLNLCLNPFKFNFEENLDFKEKPW